jgi:tetratricopeptide (TPR) repeat protein
MLAVICSVALSGCFPGGRGSLSEEKEPHFLNGRSLVNAMDYQGAINAFGKALEVNPHSAAAHFELGWLHADKASDPAAAIYHYQRYLELRPGAENAETIGQHIFRLKQELAKAVLPMPTTPGIQRDFEQLAQENRALREEVERLRAAYASGSVLTNLPPLREAINRTTQTPETMSGPQAMGSQPSTSNPSFAVASASASARTHRVQQGETPFSIARKYRIKVETLLSANPSLNPRRMQIGQTLSVPAS